MEMTHPHKLYAKTARAYIYRCCTNIINRSRHQTLHRVKINMVYKSKHINKWRKAKNKINHFCAVFDRLFGVERSVLAGDALANDASIVIHKHGWRGWRSCSITATLRRRKGRERRLVGGAQLGCDWRQKSQLPGVPSHSRLHRLIMASPCLALSLKPPGDLCKQNIRLVLFKRNVCVCVCFF